MKDEKKIWEETETSSPLKRDSRDLLYWVSCLEGKKGGWGQDKGRSWEVEAYRGEEEAETNGVLEAALK